MGHSPLSQIPLACAQTILLENEQRNDSSQLGGASAPECLAYFPSPSVPGSISLPFPVIIGLYVSGSIQCSMGDDYDCVYLGLPLGSEGQRVWVMRREPPNPSSKITPL